MGDDTTTERLERIRATAKRMHRIGRTAATADIEFLLDLVDRLTTERDEALAAHPGKVERVKSLVAAATRLVQIERDDARADRDALQQRLDAVKALAPTEMRAESPGGGTYTVTAVSTARLRAALGEGS